MTDEDRAKYLLVMYRYMFAHGLDSMAVRKPPKRKLSKAEKAQYVAAFEKFMRVHGLTVVDMDDAMKWLTLTDNLPPISPEQMQNWQDLSLYEAVRPLLHKGVLLRRRLVDAIGELTGHLPE